MGVMTGEDPLTCDIEEIFTYCTWPRTREGSCLLCDANDLECHSDLCPWSPIYATMVDQINSPRLIASDVAWAAGNFIQHVIKCAHCGREQMAKDMDVIYQAPLYNSAGGSHLYDYKYPHNIVKAVCPEHNRRGTVGFQGVPPSGFERY